MQRIFRLGMIILWPLLMGLTVAPVIQHDQPQTIVSTARSEQTTGIQEEWLGVYQDEEKVGYLQRRLTPTKTGYAWEEHWWLSLQLANETYVTHTEVRAQADHTCALTSFSLWSSGGETALYIKADITKQSSSRRKIQGESINNGEATSFTVALDLPLHLPPLCQMAVPRSSRPGTNREFSVFNPLSLQAETIRLTTLGMETIEINGQQQIATKLVSGMSDSALYLWVDHEGRTLREEIAPSVILQRESQELATTGSWQERGILLPNATTDVLDAAGKE